jgi:hypothetical protein
MNKTLNLTLSFFLLSAIAAAQSKLPNVQEGSARAPAGIKIDGKATEWGNSFKAYNKATDIYYTLSNDDDNLYLVVHSADIDVLMKITYKGLILTINPEGKKSDQNAASILYPVFEQQYKNAPGINFDDDQSGQTFSNDGNKKLRDNEKYIKTNGLKGIDTLLSIYNRDGIKAAQAFDTTRAYTYELAIPLKYLKLSTSKPVKFAYHISLRGYESSRTTMTENQGHKSMEIWLEPGAGQPRQGHENAIRTTTDFWGEYTLADK